MFEEDIKINIFNGTKEGNIAKTFADSLIPYGFNIPSK
jgi:formaldehyde-activating enzyme involved in methanogenesis